MEFGAQIRPAGSAGKAEAAKRRTPYLKSPPFHPYQPPASRYLSLPPSRSRLPLSPPPPLRSALLCSTHTHTPFCWAPPPCSALIPTNVHCKLANSTYLSSSTSLGNSRALPPLSSRRTTLLEQIIQRAARSLPCLPLVKFLSILV